MPVIGIPVEMLKERISTPLEPGALVEKLQQLGCDVEGFATLRRFGCQNCGYLMEITETENPPVVCEACGADFKQSPEKLVAKGENDVIRMELLAVRPDMFDPGGLARVLRNYLGESDQPARYELQPSTITVEVEDRLSNPESYRPCIACAVIRGITLDDDIIKVVMKLQENLHWALGRDRKRASIGVYDLDTLEGTEFHYKTVGPEERTFVPLGCQDEQTPRKILETHPKGMAYARLLKPFERYPLLTDQNGTVLSMPPIINSESTRVTHGTKNFFVDVTGTETRIVEKTLNTLVTSLLELDPKARLEQVNLRRGGEQRTTPDLTPQEVTLDPAHPPRLIGVEMDDAAVEKHLKAMGHSVTRNGSSFKVGVPAYRNDIIHPVDLVEDVAIAYGYHNISPSLVPTMTVGSEQPKEILGNQLRRILTGLGYFEVLTLILSSEEAQFEALRRPGRQDYVQLEHPISVEQTMIRTTLIPGLLDTFSVNTDHELPQHIFEVGKVTRLCDREEVGAREYLTLAAAAIGSKVDFAELRAALDAVLSELGLEVAFEPSSDGVFLPGRGAAVKLDGQIVGVLGEVHPEVLERFKLAYPVSLFELDLTPLL